MEKVNQLSQLILRSRRLPGWILTLTLLILAGAIGLTTWQVRDGIRRQMEGMDGKVLHKVVLMEYENDVLQGLAGPISDVANQLNLVLKSASLPGMLGIRLFDASGQFVETFPPYVSTGIVQSADLPVLAALQPVSHFRPKLRADELFITEVSETDSARQPLPLLEVNVPLHSQEEPRLAGIAQFLIEGHSIAAEFARLDRRLILQSLVVFAVGGSILVLALSWAFRRLRRTQQLLAERSEHLVQANEELALAAKTSALGSVTAHLLHGLKSPLAGLQSYVTTRAGHTGNADNPDWQLAVASTRRMQAMINQTVSVLREEQAATHYEITGAEIMELVQQRMAPLAREKEVAVAFEGTAKQQFPNRTANLVVLILTNLLQNAIQATPPGRQVRLVLQSEPGAVAFAVHDAGPGFPEHQTPFTPCRSSKEGGCGIGLALSKQLAQHLGATLELQSSSPRGCVFVLRLPAPRRSESPSQPAVTQIG